MHKGLTKEALRRAGRSALRFALIAALLLPTYGASTSPERQISEYEVKAAYVYYFAKFTEWPAEALPASNSPIVIGVLGNNEFTSMLETIVKGKTVQSHPISVQALKMPASFSNCHIIYISSSEHRYLRQIAESVQGMPVLTVTETEKGARSKGLINLLDEGGKVQFEVDLAGAAKAKLKISSKLLRLANAFSE